MEKIGVVVLNYMTFESTIECIDSLKKFNDNRVNIYIIDNCSTNNSYDILNEKYLNDNKIEVIKNEFNGGYAAGNNVGVKKALEDNCDYIIISNNDIIFLENSINNLVNTSRINNIDVVGPLLLNLEKKIQRDACRNFLGYKEKIFCTTFFRKIDIWGINKEYFYKDYDYKDIKKVYMLSGSCILFKKSVFEKIGLLDENTFLYEEEPILFKKINDSGLQVAIEPMAKVIHKHGETTKNAKVSSFIYFIKSEKYYCNNYLKITKTKYIFLKLIRIIQFIVKYHKEEDFKANLREVIYI